MRHIKTVNSIDEAEGALTLLGENGIEARAEQVGEAFEIWVLSDDKIQQATALFSTAVPKIKRLRIIAKQAVAGERWAVTKILILLCVIIYFFQSSQMAKKGSIGQRMGLPPITLSMLYDYPQPFEQLYDYLEKNPQLAFKDPTKAVKGPYWKGIYSIFLGDPEYGPLFEKIREGEVYRLITPSIMHGGLLHILFNMLWLWLLGKQVEHRVGIVRYLALSLIIGVISNTGQYLMSGFLFLGYSGIVAGLAGFIWMRQKVAPWEGYPLPRATIIFLAIFILGMSLLSVVSFIFAKFNIARFPDILANTGHIVGALTGILCARIPIFVRRPH